ncbi:hypothetical protein AAZX31_01G141400 [Glycine max]
MPPRGPWTCTLDYIPLFYRVSHPYAIPSEKREPACSLVRLSPILVELSPGQTLAEIDFGWRHAPCRAY